MRRQIVLNKGECTKCKDGLVSNNRHDFVRCSCGESFLDGGTEYIRSGGPIKLTTVYADDDFELVRKSASRGSRGPNGDQPLSYIPICDMDDDHLEAVLEYGGAPWHIEIIKKEIEWRKSGKM